MPLITPTDNPFSGQTINDCWAFCSRLELDFNNKLGRIVYSVYADKASAYSGCPPLQVHSFAITNNPGDTPGIPTFDALVGQNAEAYTLLLTALDALMLQQPQFAGGIVDTNLPDNPTETGVE